MAKRMDLAVDKGCEGVDPDNVNGYDNETGFDLTAEDQLEYNTWLAEEAHARGLFVALKNDGGQASELAPLFDLELNEECHEFGECADLAPFRAADKPILNIEYVDDEAAASALAADLCPRAAEAGTRTLIMPRDLDGTFRVACD